MTGHSTADEVLSLILDHRASILAVERWSEEEQKPTAQPLFQYDYSDPVIQDGRFVASTCELERTNDPMLHIAWSARRQEIFEECIGRDFLESERLREVITTYGTHWKNAAHAYPRDFGIKSLYPVAFLEPYLPRVTLRLHELGKTQDFAKMRIAEGDHQIAFTIGIDEAGEVSVDLPERPPSLIDRGYPVYEGDELLKRFGKPIASVYRAVYIADRGMSEYAGRLGLTRHFEKMTCALCSNEFWPQALNSLDIVRTGIPRYCFECHRLRSDVWRKIPLEEDARRSLALRSIELVHELTGMFPFKNLKRQPIGHLEPEVRDRWFLAQILMPDQSVGELFGSWDDMLSKTENIGARPRKGRGGYVSKSKCGHVCYSLGERLVCDRLHDLGVGHQKEPKYPQHEVFNPAERLRADWLVSGVWMELAGYPDDSTYMRKMAIKQELAIELGLDHLVLMPADLNNIDPALESAGILGPDGVSRVPGDVPAVVPPPRQEAERPEVETFVCARCAKEFTRTRKRGRKPHECPECRGVI